MRNGLQIGKILGITIRIDWSWFLVFFLITWSLSVSLRDMHEDWGTGLHWFIASIAALLFFGSVLAHEMAHSLMARAQGVPVRSITLFLFGGVSNIQREPPSPRAEFLITIVGPITSIVLGMILLFSAEIAVGSLEDINRSTTLFKQLGPVATLVIWLGSINIILGIFNMIPGFPLDGGRILRSILWAITGNLRQATQWASWVGQAVAGLFVLSGVAMFFGVQVPFFGSGVLNGLWLLFIGLFLHNAAVQSYRRVVIQDLLSDISVAKLMRTDPPTVPSNISVENLINFYIMQLDDHAFPVVDDMKIVGVVTLQDIRAVSHDKRNTTTVHSIMTPIRDLVMVEPDDEAADAVTQLMTNNVRQIPVVQNGNKLVGVLRRQDVFKWLQLQSVK